MRPIERMPVVLEALGRVWAMAPDLRLGQLLVILTPPGKDPFNLEDDDLLAALRKMADDLSQTELRIRPDGFSDPADYASAYAAAKDAPLEMLIRRRDFYAPGDQAWRAIDDVIKSRERDA